MSTLNVYVGGSGQKYSPDFLEQLENDLRGLAEDYAKTKNSSVRRYDALLKGAEAVAHINTWIDHE